jgi:hypothetical protein
MTTERKMPEGLHSGALRARLNALLDEHEALAAEELYPFPLTWEDVEAAYARARHYAEHGEKPQRKQAYDTLALVDFILLNAYGMEAERAAGDSNQHVVVGNPDFDGEAYPHFCVEVLGEWPTLQEGENRGEDEANDGL